MTGGWIHGLMTRRSAALLLVLAILLGGFLPIPLPAAPILARVNSQIIADSGLTATAKGRAHLTLLPVPRLTLRAVGFAQPGQPPLLEAAQLAVRFRLLPIFAGVLEVDHLIAQAAVVDARPAMRDAWAMLRERRGDGTARLRLTLAQARLRLTDGPDDVQAIDATVDVRRASGLVSLWGHGQWHGQAVALQAVDLPLLGPPAAGVPLAIGIETPYATLQAKGRLAYGKGDGSLQITMRDATALSLWLGMPVPLAGLLDQFALQGQGTATTSGFQLTDARLQFGGNTLTGAVSYADLPGERPHISGTLATDSFELNAIAAAVDAAQDAQGNWNSDLFDTRSLMSADLDLRVSAGRARIMKMVLADAALSAALKNGRLDLTLGRSVAYGGSLRARATITRQSETVTEQRWQTTFDAIDFGRLSDDMFGMRLLSGRGTGQFQGEATGASPLAIVRGMAGRATVALQQGEISGISLADTLRRAERDAAMPQPASLSGGSTRFDTANFTLAIQSGAAQLIDGQIAGQGGLANVGGQILLAARAYQLTGAVLHPLRPRQWPFEITGPWSRPQARLLPMTPAQRSDAARQPLSTRSRS